MKLSDKRILYVVSSMGLGHVQRSLPIIRLLLRSGSQLTLLSHGRALALLKQELAGQAGLDYLDFKDYPPLQRGRGIVHYFYYPLDLLAIALHMRKEKQYLQRLRQDRPIDLVFADGRFGFVDSSFPCFLICHQISFLVPPWLRIFQLFADVGQLLMLRKFTRVIVPDFADPEVSLAGRLSHNWVARRLQPLYIGFLSTLEKLPDAPKDLDLLFVIGGFIVEERRRFIQWAGEALATLGGRSVLVTGDMDLQSVSPTDSRLELRASIHGAERNQLMNSADMLVGRTGYTTVMDCCELGLSALLMPTKNMTEQEYLADRIAGWGHVSPVQLPAFGERPWTFLEGRAVPPEISAWSTARSVAQLESYLNELHEPAESGGRVFCFLQGPAGYFFWKLALLLQQQRYRTTRINVCAGDWLNWPGRACHYRGRFEQWEPFVEQQFREQGVTDLFLLGEQRPYHRVAVAVAQRMGIKVVVCELGYLRPEWLTLELNGMSGNSSFPRDSETISRLAKDASPVPLTPSGRSSFFREAVADVSFHVANLAFWYAYPHYRSHLLQIPLLLDIGIGLHMLLARINRSATSRRVKSVLASGRPFFVFPLQIENDFQIRAYSSYRSVANAIDEVLTSFARYAPADCLLVIKEHPREVIGQRWHRLCKKRALELGLQERLVCLDGGSLDALLVKARGVVTINSTAGLHALTLGCPTKVLGTAVYDVAGMTDQTPLDQFWQSPVPPNPVLCDAYVRLLAATIQVKGGFYSVGGVQGAVEEIAQRLVANRVGV